MLWYCMGIRGQYQPNAFTLVFDPVDRYGVELSLLFEDYTIVSSVFDKGLSKLIIEYQLKR